MPLSPWIIAFTGASGICYGRELLRVIDAAHPEQPLEVFVSDSAYRVMQDEEGLEISPSRISAQLLIGKPAPQIRFHNNKNIGSAFASGSQRTQGMVIVPCSMKSLAAVAHGYSDDLIHRAADVTMKEQRKLIIVPRETPLSPIHLENMLRLSRIPGVCILPAMPGFYNGPKTIEDLVSGVVQRIVDHMGLAIEISPRWGADEATE